MKFSEQINRIQALRKEIQEDKDFVAKEKASYEEKIAIPRERVKEKEYQISCIDTQDVFINIEDIVEEVANMWNCSANELDVEILGDRHFDNDVNDTLMRRLIPHYSLSEFLLRIKDNDRLFWVKFSIKKTDIQLDGKSFEEHIIAKPSGSGKVCSVDDWKNIVLRVRFERIVRVCQEKVEYHDERAELLARAIKRKEARDAEIEEEQSENRLARKARLKNNSLLRLCPDCGQIISWCTHFKAFQHGSSSDCAYMENKEGKRIWDNKMLEESLNITSENDREVYI